MKATLYLYGTLLFLLTFSTVPILAQDCPCCEPAYNQFDFWIGEWVVYDSLGQQVGTNQIEKAQKGCLIVESWCSEQGSTGTSYNYFLPRDSTWNQVWIDDRGGVLELKGNLEGSSMVLTSILLKDQQGSGFYHRISWKPEGDQVIQTWEVLNASYEVRRLLFRGFYRKSGS
jgi:hypothetical protein